jgi:hypothetical protein
MVPQKPQEGTIYLLMNNLGILLGIYRDLSFGIDAAKKYIVDGDISLETHLYIYRADTRDVGRAPGNQFLLVWKQDVPSL